MLSEQLYSDFRRLAEGTHRLFRDRQEYEQLVAHPKRTIHYSPQEAARVDEVVEEEIRNGRLARAEKQERISALIREESLGIVKFHAEDVSNAPIPQQSSRAILAAPSPVASTGRTGLG